jgi:hypothetical protein
MLYQIIFEDDSIFIGKNIENSSWKYIDKPIKEITYTLQNNTVKLNGYEEYNHLIYRTRVIGIGAKIIGTLLLAKQGNMLHCFSFDCKKETMKHLIYPCTKKFQPPQMTGWKIGISSEKPSFTIL